MSVPRSGWAGRGKVTYTPSESGRIGALVRCVPAKVMLEWCRVVLDWSGMQDFLSDLQHDSMDPRLVRTLREAQRAIMVRPQISIRLRFVVSLGLCFLLCCVFAVATVQALATIRDSMLRVQMLEQVAFQVESARAIESGELVSTGTVGHALEHTARALALLDAQTPRSGSTVNRAALAAATEKLTSYRGLLAAGVPTAASLEELKAIGGEVGAMLASVNVWEKEALARILRAWEWGPLVLLGALLLLFAIIAMSFGRALVRPIRKFQRYTRRIAAGDFSLIPPTRPYRDEFSELALAVNRMLAELQSHQDRCVRAGKLAAVGTITSGIAHELNNPLNNISITTESLMEDWLEISDEEKWRLLQDVYFETERASEIVKSLLDFTRTERPELLPVDIVEVIQRTFRLVQNEMSLADVTFGTELPAGVPKVLGAFDQLRQVFLNLFLNAIQAMPKGGQLTVAITTAEPGRVCVEVRDTGSGIPADVLPHIFDPFFTTKEPGLGTGLGLSVSSSIIKKHGGEIHVTSELGGGTTFHVCLPVANGS